MIRNNDYFEIIKEQNKELAKFRPFTSAYEMKKEIERLSKEVTMYDDLLGSINNEVNRLNNIIKEVREYIEKNKVKLPLVINDFTCEMVYSDEVVLVNELLKILKGVDKNE